MSEEDIIIYVKPGQKHVIAKRHPGVSIDSIHEHEEVDQPVVCKTEGGTENCEIGEQWIDTMSKKVKNEV